MPAGPGANHLVAFALLGDGTTTLAWTTHDANGARVVLAPPPTETSSAPLGGPFPVGRSAADLLAHDVDGDGRPELVACDEEAHALRLLRFDWDDALQAVGARVEALELPAGPTAAVALTDGRLAVSCADASGGSGVALVALRDGRLVLDEYAPSATLCTDLAAADLDGDGAAELLVLTKASALDSAGNLEVWRRSDRWQRALAVPTGARPYGVVAADWSGDGRAEVLVSAQNSHNVGLWRVALADGVPRLERQADLGVGLGPLALALVDLDADGVLELVVANAFSDDLSIVRRR
ncbi:MAG: VCBS repeat-containing protein [Planctomycetes bacterium]|nr:VCBS repeat-containing protein [Planctomycetota bacterium]